MAETAAAAPVATATEQQNSNTENGASQGAQAAGNGSESTVVKPEITDEIGLGWLKERGIAVSDLSTLKQKVEYTPPPPPPTDEQKTKAEKDRELKLVNLYLSKEGTTPEQYALLKTIIAADPKDIGLTKELESLIKEGFTKEKAEEIVRQMHLQISDEDIDATEDEEEKQALKKAKSYGSKKQENRGLYIQKQAKTFLDSLQTELQELESEKELMAQHSVKVTEAVKNFTKKQTLEIGQIDNVAIAPVDFEVSDEALTEAETILKDASQFQKQLYNKDGSVNIDFLLPHLVRSLSFSDAVKRGYLTGTDRQVEFFQNKFGSVNPSLGGAKKPDGKGTIVEMGKPQLMEGRPATK